MHGEPDLFNKALLDTLGRWGLPIRTEQVAQLRSHFDAIVAMNRRFNLTRITDPVEAAVKHYADSLALLLWVRERRTVNIESVLDVGTGPGFPAVPLAVMRPDWSLTAIDATAKKVRFLADVVDAASSSRTPGLANLDVVHAHSAHWQPGQSFGLVMCRAVAPLPKCLKEAAGFVRHAGWFVAYKTDEPDSDEVAEATDLAPRLGLRCEPRHEYDLELHEETVRRALFVYQRVK